MKKKILAIVIACALMISTVSAINVQDSISIEDSPDHAQLVTDYWESINDGNWLAWTEYFTPAVQDIYSDFVSNPENQEDNIGILNVNHVDVLSVQQVSNFAIPTAFYPELQQFFENESLYECYLVALDCEVNEPSAYYNSGLCYRFTIVVNEDESWGIGATFALKNDGTNPMGRGGIGYGTIEFCERPETINVRDENGDLHRNVDFNDFIFNVTCNEIGNMGFDDEAIKAQIICIKMCGWWAVAGSYRIDQGCDLTHSDVAFRSDNRATAGNQTLIRDLIDEIDRWYMVTESTYGGELFYANFNAGSSNANGQGDGIFHQYGADYLATNRNYQYDWKEILHYYYDNSSYNNDGVGVVQINSGPGAWYR